jgi:GNAT superfamily N-acetyltransferase
MTARAYHRDEDVAIVELLDLVFKGWPKYDLEGSKVDFWRWKYIDSPLPSMILVIEEEELLVSSYHSWRQKVWVNGKTWIFESGMDFTVHPDYRRRGLSKQISQLARDIGNKENIPVNNTVTEQPIILHGHNKNESVKLFPKKLVNLTRINDIDRQLQVMPVNNSWVIKLGYRALDLMNNIVNMFKGKPILHDIDIRLVDAFPESINEYWDQIKSGLDYSLVLSVEYLNWRYCDSRIGGYQVHIAEEKGQTVGYIVTRINKKYPEYPIGYIVELSYLPGRAEIGYQLLDKALPYLSEVNVVNFLTIEGHPDIELMKRFGYHNSRILLHSYYENYIQPDPLELIYQTPSNRVHISWGDFDILPVKMPKK